MTTGNASKLLPRKILPHDFWEQSHLILSPTSERTYDLVVLVQRMQSNSFKQVLKNYLNNVR